MSSRFCAPVAGFYTLEARYAKGASGTATRTIVIDGEPYTVAPRYLPTWSWTSWTEGGRRSFYLEAGEHEIALAHTESDSGDIRLQSLTFEGGPSSSEVSVRALFMNDWDDVVVGWQAAKLYPADERPFGPRMTSIHMRYDWSTNQIDEAQAFFRDETGDFAYSEPNRFESSAYFVASEQSGYGELHAEYGPYGDEALPVKVRRVQVVPPDDEVILVRYDLENVTEGPRELALLEWVDLHNKTTGPSEDTGDTGDVSPATGTLKAEWLPDANAWIGDMTLTNGTALVVGSFEPVDHHVAGAPQSGTSDKDAATVQAFFEDPSSLADATEYEGDDAGVGLSKTVRLEPGAVRQVAFFYGTAQSVDEARRLARRISSQRSSSEIAEGASLTWKNWLASGKVGTIQPPVPAWREAAELAILTIRQSQQPEFGTFVAATNPAYYYSVWPRDAAVTAIGLDAAGYLDAAEKYWTWMAQAQEDGSTPDYPPGTWWTNYGYWSKDRGIPFVSPEWDSLGLFLSGVYHHHEALRAAGREAAASVFLSGVWSAVQASADFIAERSRRPENHGFGPPDFSIWEEDLAYHTFTQVTYVAGLRAAHLLARARGERGTDGGGEPSSWSQAADSIREAIFRPVSATPCPGLWNDDLRYFIRSVKPDCTPNKLVDAATDLLWVLGVLSPDDPRAMEHREAVLANLTPAEDAGFGVARYEGDPFYASASFSPGGEGEANAPMPTWPQMTMYMAMLEHWRGLQDISSNRLSWYVATTPTGLVPHGEAVDWTTQRPLISTAAEPVTGAWFVLGLLNQLGEFDPRVPAEETQAEGQ